MECRSYPFEKLPFSELFCNYIRHSDSLATFYEAHPFDEERVAERAENFAFPGHRDRSADALTAFNRLFDAPEETFAGIEKLREPDGLAVVTGQQLTLYGGPLFTVYKTITAILYARRWEKLLKRPVVPVFWLADEDHDYEEAGEVGLLQDDVYRKLHLKNGSGSLPVGRETLGRAFAGFEDELFDIMPVSDFSDKLIGELQQFYREGVTFREAFAGWMLHLFGDYGIVLAGSDDPAIKKLISEPMVRAADRHGELFERLDRQSSSLEGAGYTRQAMVQESNLFYLDPGLGRQKLERDGSRWVSGNGRSWNGKELLDDIRNNPQNFSPNVFLRPIMQDRLLPTLAYVSGPGELAYFGQMKSAYEWMGQQMPLLLPRFSITLKEPAIDRIMNELPLEMHEFAGRIEDVEALYVERTDSHDVEGLFSAWQQSVSEITEEQKKQIRLIDPTLEAAADKAGTVFNNEIEGLKKKTYRSIKKQESIQLNRIRRIKENLFPGGSLQERQIALIFYMNKYGCDLWDRLIETLEDEVPDSHKIVQL